MNIFKKEDYRGKVVSCNDCKCLLYEIDAQKILSTPYSINILYGKYIDSYRYYCNEHKKKYELETEKDYDTWGNITYKYYKIIEVDNEGEPIGYKKIKSNE